MVGQGCVCSCALLRSARDVLVLDAALLIGIGLASRYRFLTFFFSSVYLNYIVPNLPVTPQPPSSHGSPIRPRPRPNVPRRMVPVKIDISRSRDGLPRPFSMQHLESEAFKDHPRTGPKTGPKTGPWTDAGTGPRTDPRTGWGHTLVTVPRFELRAKME